MWGWGNLLFENCCDTRRLFKTLKFLILLWLMKSLVKQTFVIMSSVKNQKHIYISLLWISEVKITLICCDTNLCNVVYLKKVYTELVLVAYFAFRFNLFLSN